jgi:hypothetical protein
MFSVELNKFPRTVSGIEYFCRYYKIEPIEILAKIFTEQDGGPAVNLIIAPSNRAGEV